MTDKLRKEVRDYIRQQYHLNGGGIVCGNLNDLILGFAEKKEEQIEELKKLIEQMQDAKCISCTDLGGMLLKITDLEKRNIDLEQKLEQTEKDLADYQFNYPSIKELSKENAELKDKLNIRSCQNCKHNNKSCPNDGSCKNYSKWEGYENLQLTKAKELLKWWVNHCGYYDLYYAKKTEQFLKETEKVK